MNIFLDTEFTDFVRPQLISIGLATDDNQHFYAEHHLAEDWCCSDFVKQVVLPQLGKRQDRVMDANRLCIELNSWLDQFAQREPVI